MELLAQCSQILYNEELLHAKATLYLHTVPRINYKNKEEWEKAKEIFNTNIAKKIINLAGYANDITSFQGLIHYNDIICRYYKHQLYILTKNQAKEWCKHKANDELYSIIESAFAGLTNISSAGGNGSYPFMNWRKLDYLLFMEGVIFSFQNHFRSYPSNINRSWIDQIPYFECRCCNKCVAMYDNAYQRKKTNEYTIFWEVVRKFWLDSPYFCIICINKKRCDIIKLQALVRGWIVRKM